MFDDMELIESLVEVAVSACDVAFTGVLFLDTLADEASTSAGEVTRLPAWEGPCRCGGEYGGGGAAKPAV